MGAQQLYNYLTNQGVKLSLGFVKSVLKSHGLISRTVKTYKRRNKSHRSFKNKLDRCFEVSEDKKNSRESFVILRIRSFITGQRFIYALLLS